MQKGKDDGGCGPRCSSACLSAMLGLALAGNVLAAGDGELVRLVRQDCGACHGMTLQGGLGLPLTPAALKDKPVDSLVATILDGRPGTAMPPWRPFLSEGQAEWIVRRLLEGFPEDKR